MSFLAQLEGKTEKANLIYEKMTSYMEESFSDNLREAIKWVVENDNNLPYEMPGFVDITIPLPTGGFVA